jgi:hypothetical protein
MNFGEFWKSVHDAIAELLGIEDDDSFEKLIDISTEEEEKEKHGMF